MRQLNAQDTRPPQQTTVAQFGEGVFLRGFADYMIDVANEQGVFDGGVAVIKPRPFGSLDKYEIQDRAYTVILRGVVDGERFVEHRVVSAITQAIHPYSDYNSFLDLAKTDTLRFVISNTTEAGVVYDETDAFEHKPANSFPGKLTQLLYARYKHFHGAADRGLIVLPLELLEDNGAKLRDCVMKLITLWKLPAEFAAWVDEACIFCNTLVDRIVSGYPTDEAEALERDLLGYKDELMVVGEPFGLWVIESPRYQEIQREFPLDKAGMPLVFTDNQRPYRERKVRILNGAHTSTVPAAFFCGLDIVSEAMADPTLRAFMERAVYQELAPTVPLPADEVRAFADSVMERFENPFIRHALLSICLNSVAKWKARILPSLKDSLAATGKLPTCLTFSFAALATFYRSAEQGENCLIGKRGGETYEIRDDAQVLSFFAEHAALPHADFAKALLGNTAFWGEDLNKLGDMTQQIATHLEAIEKNGMRQTLEALLA
ncbi:MAG: tagaturonate reductase [Oscillospiraceae bacterium]|nr:tagaturonate reductase [Oscillospiraceae bacterium]